MKKDGKAKNARPQKAEAAKSSSAREVPAPMEADIEIGIAPAHLDGGGEIAPLTARLLTHCFDNGRGSY